MSSDRRFFLSPLARADLAEILQYTVQYWGESQERAYALQLNAAFQSIRSFPEIGRVNRGFRLSEVAEHVIVYQTNVRETTILRILHKRIGPTKYTI